MRLKPLSHWNVFRDFSELFSQLFSKDFKENLELLDDFLEKNVIIAMKMKIYDVNCRFKMKTQEEDSRCDFKMNPSFTIQTHQENCWFKSYRFSARWEAITSSNFATSLSFPRAKKILRNFSQNKSVWVDMRCSAKILLEFQRKL